MLNSTFDAQLLLYISTTILYLTVTLYYTYYEINKLWVRLVTDGDAGVVVISIVDSLYNCMKITVASYICECTIKQVKHPPTAVVRVARSHPFSTFQANRIIEIIHCCSVHEFDTEMRDEVREIPRMHLIVSYRYYFAPIRLSAASPILLANIAQPARRFQEPLLSAELHLLARGWYTPTLIKKAEDVFRVCLYAGYSLFQCISFVTTYLVIMIQWSQPIEAKSTALYENETASM